MRPLSQARIAVILFRVVAGLSIAVASYPVIAYAWYRQDGSVARSRQDASERGRDMSCDAPGALPDFIDVNGG